MDLFMWQLHISGRDKVMPIIWDLAEQLEPKHGIRIRKMSRRRLRRELDAFAEIYNEAWSRNWGFVPTSKADPTPTQELQLVFDKNWFMVAEDAGGKTIGIAISVPDINQVLKRMNGRILPFGWWYYLNRRRIVTQVRVGFLGVKPAYLHRCWPRAVRRALRHGRGDARQGRRDGLDPRDEQGHEPRHEGDGQHDRQEVPDISTHALR